nr:hypothetical protein [Escherichia coli]
MNKTKGCLIANFATVPNDTSGKPYNINYSFGELINNADHYTTLAEMIGKCDEVMYLKKKRKTLSRKTEP